ncbi:MAG TPA: hypothetical protein VM938_07610 [Acidimicrobiales bacterium]|nr:hypothetical protein [Acidimicrobiales bacterium]
MARVQRDEEGSSLILALIFLSVMSIVVASTLGLADVDFRHTVAVRDDRKLVYAADAALDAAINSYWSTGTCATPERGVVQEVNDVTPAVSCETSGGGTAVTPLNQPALAVSAQAVAPEVGINIVGGAVASVRGGVYSNTGINTTSGANLYAASPDRIVTRLGCTGGGTVGPAACETVTGPYVPGNDPGYPTAVASAPPFASVPSCPATEPVTFAPGTYTDRLALEAFMATCARRTYHFPAAGGIGSPGVYYFDFTDDGAWTIPQGYTVVGGTFPSGVTGATVGAVETLPGGRCDQDAEGVQWLFGGGSRVVVKGALELCAPHSDPTSSTPRVAVYGVRTTDSPPAAPTPQTLAVNATTAAAGSPFTPSSGAYMPNDGSMAVATVPDKQMSAISVAGFNVSSIPDTAVITSATITVRHVENESPPPTRGQPNLAKLDLQATAMSGALTSTVQTSSCGNAPNCTTTLNKSTDPRDDVLTLPASFRTKAGLAAMNVAYKATSTGGAFSASLDGVSLAVTYTPVVAAVPRFRAESGCITKAPYDPPTGDPSLPIAATSPCALITTAGSNASLAVKGTIYAPAAALDIQLVGTSYQVFGRGLVVRSLRSNITSSVGACNAVPPPDEDRCYPFQLPRGVVSAAERVLFTVKVAGVTRLRSLVRFNGAAAPTVQSWNVVNEP